MRRHSSVLMLVARSSIYKVLALMVLMGAAEWAAFRWAFAKGGTEDGFSLEIVLADSRLGWIFGAAFVVLTLILCRFGFETGGREGYTLRRLGVTEGAVFLWHSGYNMACYAILWAAQVVVAIALCRWFVGAAGPDCAPHQSPFLAFYRRDFLHNLLPFEDWVLWVRNGVDVVALGLCTAALPMARRKGARFPALIPLACGVMVFFVRELGSAGWAVLTICLAVVCTMAALRQISRKEEPVYEGET